MQDKNIKLYRETSKVSPPPSCEALSFISTAAATELLPNQKSVCHRCYTDKPSASTVAEEGRRTKAGVSVLTVFFQSCGLCTRLLLCEVAVAVWAAAVALWLLLVYHFCVHDMRVQPSRPFAPATRLCSLLLSFFNAPLALVKGLRTGLMSTFRTVSVFPRALVTARYFHLCQPFQRFKSMLTNRMFAA